MAHLTSSPYNLTGVYAEEVMGDPEFEPWARKRAVLHGAVERIVRDGIREGAFVAVPSELVRESIAGILVRTLTIYSGGRRRVPDNLGDEIASFVSHTVLLDMLPDPPKLKMPIEPESPRTFVTLLWLKSNVPPLLA